MNTLLQNLFFPPKCFGCGDLLSWKHPTALCPTCFERIQDEERDACGYCGKPVTKCTCPTRTMKKAGFKILLKTAYYKIGKDLPPQNNLLFKMKRTASKRLYGYLTAELSRRLEAFLTEEKLELENCVFSFAPRSQAAKIRTGIDQAELLAKALSERFGVPTVNAILRVKGKNAPQKSLDYFARQKNAEESYQAANTHRVQGKTVFLLDDTVTTGATMSACGRILKKLGAKRVIAFSFTMDEVGRYPKESSYSTKPYA